MNDYYTSLLDDALTSLNTAEKKLDQVKDLLLTSGHPGVRLANRRIEPINDLISECRRQMDELPAELAPQSIIKEKEVGE